MAAKRFVAFEGVFPEGPVIMDLIELGSSAVRGTFHMRPVKHGGEDANGKLKETPTARDFMMLYLTEHPRFDIKDAREHASTLGLSSGSIYAICNALVKEGYLKRVGKGEYATTVRTAAAPKVKRGRPTKAVKAKAAKKAEKKAEKKAAPKNAKISAALRGKPKPKPGQTMRDKITALLRDAPSGMDISNIKEVLQTNGKNSVSPTLTSMLRDNIITRPKPRTYILATPTEAAAH